jgi:hypothetical protein
MRERAVAERNGDKTRFGRERRRLDFCRGNTLQNCKRRWEQSKQHGKLLGVEEDEPDI